MSRLTLGDRVRRRMCAAAVAGPLAILCAALLFMWRPIFAGEVFLPIDALLHMHPWRYSYERVPVNNHVYTDIIRQIYPRRVLTEELVRQGAWPLWNSSILSGTPLLDDGQLAFFYPPSLIFLALPADRAMGAYALIQLAIAGLGTYAFARRIGLVRGAATLAGVCYMFAGQTVTYLQFPELIGGIAMAPWCFWAAERALARGGWRSWLVVGAALALALLAQIQIAFYIYVGVGVYVLVRAAQLRRPQPLAGLALAVAVALALSAVQLAPALVLSSLGQRSDVGLRMPPPEEYVGSLLRLALPALGGFERVGQHSGWGPAPLQVPYPYVGLAPLLLAPLALGAGRHRLAWVFGLMAVLAFALAVRTPLLQLFAALLPHYRQFDDHTRWYTLWSLGIAVLAGMGAQAIREGSGRRAEGSGRRAAGGGKWDVGRATAGRRWRRDGF